MAVGEIFRNTLSDFRDSGRPLRVLDLCAAPGGKSFTLAQMMGDEGELLACDLQGYKAALIAEGAQRLGLSAVRAQVHDARQPLPGGEADRILCDVPC